MPKTTKKCKACKGSGLVPDDVKTGATMKKLRESANITQERFAKHFKRATSLVSGLESGDRRWNLSVIKRYLAVLKKLSPKTKKHNTK